MQRTDALEKLIRKFEQESVVERVVALEAELDTVCVNGEKAERDFQSAKNKELSARNSEQRRIDRYNAATRNLNNAKNEPLGSFHTNKDVTRKLGRIANAQAEVESAMADMQAHPMAIPQVVNEKAAAEERVNTLAGKSQELASRD
jgi:exoribonuclease R